MIRLFVYFFVVVILASSCGGKQKNTNPSGKKAESTLLSEQSDSIRYARGFEVEHHNGYIEVNVRDPWNDGKLLQRYLLVHRDKKLPTNMPKGTVVRVPIRNAAVYTSVHCSALAELDATDEIIGICETRYIIAPKIRSLIKSGRIADIGESTAPNVEKMIAIGAEVILASPFNNNGYGAVEKIGIPIIECADYMESDPLGRAEWLKFFGLLTGRSALADSLFRATEASYLQTKSLTSNVAHKPKLLTGMRYGSTWYVSSGESFMAKLFSDAGADYMFSDLKGAGGTPMSFESVLNRAIHADIWLIQYNSATDMTYRSLRADYPSYEQFDAFRNRRVFGCNTNMSRYYEEMPMHPDYLLKELIAVLHPELLPEYVLRYFAPLED